MLLSSLKFPAKSLWRANPVIYFCIRHRSSYYRNKKIDWITRPIKRFLYRYPKSPFVFLFSSLVLIVLQPTFHGIYARLVLDREDYNDYRRVANQITMNRTRFGDDLYIPFYSEDHRTANFNFYKQRTQDRRAGRLLSKIEDAQKPIEMVAKPEVAES